MRDGERERGSFYSSYYLSHTHTLPLSPCVALKKVPCWRLMLEITRTEGVRYLFKGLGPRLVVVPSMLSCMYVLNEELEQLLLGTTKTVM